MLALQTDSLAREAIGQMGETVARLKSFEGVYHITVVKGKDKPKQLKVPFLFRRPHYYKYSYDSGEGAAREQITHSRSPIFPHGRLLSRRVEFDSLSAGIHHSPDGWDVIIPAGLAQLPVPSFLANDVARFVQFAKSSNARFDGKTVRIGNFDDMQAQDRELYDLDPSIGFLPVRAETKWAFGPNAGESTTENYWVPVKGSSGAYIVHRAVFRGHSKGTLRESFYTHEVFLDLASLRVNHVVSDRDLALEFPQGVHVYDDTTKRTYFEGGTSRSRKTVENLASLAAKEIDKLREQPAHTIRHPVAGALTTVESTSWRLWLASGIALALIGIWWLKRTALGER